MPSCASGDRIYAIGDIHGRYDLLRDLLRRIEAHSNGLPSPRGLHVLLLGDVVDRGPDSAKVLRFLHDWSRNTQGQLMLLGNHEEVMLRVYGGEARLLTPWLRIGGRETLESFGLKIPRREEREDTSFTKLIGEVLPRELMDFVAGWPLTAQSGDYYFCHAGVKPGVALNRQDRKDLIWIRDEFLQSARDHGATVVHGHSISPEVDFQSNRIGLDTGAYKSGILSALYLEGMERQVIATAGEARPEPQRSTSQTAAR